MKIFLAADHRGFALKENAKTHLAQQSHEVVDTGAFQYEPEDDYVDYGKPAIAQMESDDKAILFCGSGHGMDILANRHSKVRAILGFNQNVIKQGREHENANVLVIPADWVSPEEISHYLDIFINTPFSNAERHIRRLEKLDHP